ncbi:hypothetical protein GWO57_08265 [Corynebacterium macginleyi]|uniref:hypothetical protein n=1 Tax=Corynebacterium macginleyi TaxID=38290 RepID=UPI00190B22AB|nr:hypothetical protein [Corynebacterium macginleyi]MBK4144628.1 hypothetical protein [Corynebacterium macginleyi]
MGQLNPTRQEIINAHQALETFAAHGYMSAMDRKDEDATREREEAIRKLLPPIPHPTMNDIEWDDSKHYLAEADHPTWGKVIMLFKKAETGNIFVNFHEGGEQHFIYCTPEHLTPTGRRYALQEGE